MAETAPPWQENQPYEVRVTAKPLRSLTYDVLPPAPSSDTTAVVQEAGAAVVVKRAASGAEREFRGRPAKTTPLDAALDDAARVLRMLYVADLRKLQDAVNTTIVALQEFTANPKTDSRLGRVGH